VSYWKTHQGNWTVTSLTIGGVTYNQEQLVAILTAQPKGDVTYSLAQQLIAIRLNIAGGADPAAVSADLASADAWLAAHPLGSKPSGSVKTQGNNLAATLSDYNNGVIGPGHCGDITPTPQPTDTPQATVTAAVIEKKIDLCHSTASRTNPYNFINVSINSVENAISVHGHGDHIGAIFPADPWGDIIPPFIYEGKDGRYAFPGLNWTVEGQAVYNNGCQLPATPTPVPTSTSTPTPEPTQSTSNFQYTCQVGPAVDSNTGQSCTDNFYNTVYNYHGGNWWVVGTYCMTNEQCQDRQGPPLDTYTYLPCVPRLTDGGIVIECKPNEYLETWNVRAETNTSCPINTVLRSPYPRSLVNVSTQFVLQPTEYDVAEGNVSDPQSPANLATFVDANGNPTASGVTVGLWKNLRLYMRSHRFNGGESWFGQAVPPPQWSFNDRSWNIEDSPVAQEGAQASYVYHTSSAGLDTLYGRAFDPVNNVPADTYNLPAYGVTVRSFCGHEWKVTVTLAVKRWQPTGTCYLTMVYPDGTTYEPPGTSNEGCPAGYVSQGNWTYAWDDRTTDWAGIDLTQIGRPTSYDMRTRTVSGGLYKGQEYWDTPSGVWVPVVEVQSVLRDECVAAGSCEPPKADPSGSGAGQLP